MIFFAQHQLDKSHSNEFKERYYTDSYLPQYMTLNIQKNEVIIKKLQCHRAYFTTKKNDQE